MAVMLLACEVFRPELEMLAREGRELPQIIYLEARLHDIPDKLRKMVQDTIDAFEAEHEGEDNVILMGYGLCGRGLCGVTSRRATLVYPRVHDCISVIFGMAHSKDHSVSREGPVFWATPGMLESFMIEDLDFEKLYAKYEAKVGPKKAARMVKVEKAIMQNYDSVTNIVWPEMKGMYEAAARKCAAAIEIPYLEIPGSSGFFRALVDGGNDERFLHIGPGQTIDMDLDGSVIAVPCKS
ncbi:DUF1638 domain-containing protein [Mailhella sp.]|uniref:DUF1638 domain-containing protein n=1 Tax=Mailhella sp. TaxID=1981029 RepID=UPI004062AA68